MLKKSLITDKSWDKFSRIISDFVDTDVGKQTILWKKRITQPSSFGEDSGKKYIDIPLEVLIDYNVYRNWPMNRSTFSGEIDKQSIAIIISSRLLEELGYLDKDGYWDFDEGLDRFVLNGKFYRSSGDTTSSQAKNKALLFQVILKREETTKSN